MSLTQHSSSNVNDLLSVGLLSPVDSGFLFGFLLFLFSSLHRHSVPFLSVCRHLIHHLTFCSVRFCCGLCVPVLRLGTCLYLFVHVLSSHAVLSSSGLASVSCPPIGVVTYCMHAVIFTMTVCVVLNELCSTCLSLVPIPIVLLLYEWVLVVMCSHCTVLPSPLCWLHA